MNEEIRGDIGGAWQFIQKEKEANIERKERINSAEAELKQSKENLLKLKSEIDLALKELE